MFSSGSQSNNNATAVQGVQINSSNYGKPLPIVYGQNRLSTNVIGYNNFQAHAQSAGGKGGGGGATTYTYTAAVQMAISEGIINGIGNIFKNRGVLPYFDENGLTPLQQEGLTLSLGTASQAPWSYWVSAYPDMAIAYAGTAWVANSVMALDNSGGIPNYNFEILGKFQTANPYNNRGNWSASGVYAPGDFVIDTTVGLPYVCFAAVGPSATPPSEASGTAGDPGFFWTALISTTPDANMADVIPDVLTNPIYGAGFPLSSLSDLTDYRNYCIAAGFFFSPVLDNQQQVQQYLSDWTTWSNSAIVWSQAKLKIIPYGDEQLIGNGVTWTPSLGIAYALTDDDFIYEDGSDPVTVNRTAPSDAYNNIKLEYSDRQNNYNNAIVEAMDQGAIDLYGLRPQNAATAHGICVASIAQLSCQLQLQRALYIRNSYQFTLTANFCLLEPMDLVALNDVVLGFDQLIVRVTEIEEDDQMNLKVTAEDFIPGVGTARLQETQRGGTTPLSPNAEPGDVAAPVMFNLPSSAAVNAFGSPNSTIGTGSNQVAIAVAGLGPNYGGCEIWVSVNGGTTYAKAGTVNGSARYGANVGDYPITSDPDTSHTLHVNLSASGGTLASGITADADHAGTLCIIGSELISYTTATLTAPNQYDLKDYIRRGQLNTAIADHPDNSPFVRLDNEVYRIGFNAAQNGITLYVKFLAFNKFGQKLQSLADVSPYTIVLGSPALIPSPVTGLMLSGSWQFTSFTVGWNPSVYATSYTVKIYASDGTTLLRTAATTANSFTYTNAMATGDGDLERTYVVKVIASSAAGDSAASSVTVNKPAPAATTAVTSTGSGTSVTISWGASTQVDSGGYVGFYSTSTGFTPPGAGTQFYSGTSTSAPLTGLTPGTTYYVRVANYDQWSSSPTGLNYSTQYSFTA